jgi:hypothetical protein
MRTKYGVQLLVEVEELAAIGCDMWAKTAAVFEEQLKGAPDYMEIPMFALESRQLALVVTDPVQRNADTIECRIQLSAIIDCDRHLVVRNSTNKAADDELPIGERPDWLKGHKSALLRLSKDFVVQTFSESDWDILVDYAAEWAAGIKEHGKRYGYTGSTAKDKRLLVPSAAATPEDILGVKMSIVQNPNEDDVELKYLWRCTFLFPEGLLTFRRAGDEPETMKLSKASKKSLALFNR